MTLYTALVASMYKEICKLEAKLEIMIYLLEEAQRLQGVEIQFVRLPTLVQTHQPPGPLKHAGVGHILHHLHIT